MMGAGSMCLFSYLQTMHVASKPQQLNDNQWQIMVAIFNKVKTVIIALLLRLNSVVLQEGDGASKSNSTITGLPLAVTHYDFVNRVREFFERTEDWHPVLRDKAV